MQKILVVTSSVLCNLVEYETVNHLIDELVDEGDNFTIYQLDSEDKLLELYTQSQKDKYKWVGVPNDLRCPIIGHSRNAGLKISDPKDRIHGTFLINENSIVYCYYSDKFFKEYDAYIYKMTKKQYFTSASIPEILNGYNNRDMRLRTIISSDEHKTIQQSYVYKGLFGRFPKGQEGKENLYKTYSNIEEMLEDIYKSEKEMKFNSLHDGFILREI